MDGMEVRCYHGGVGRLADDMAEIRAKAPIALRDTLREGLRVGNDLAKDNARRSSGTHAKKYPGTFSTKMNRTFHGAEVSIYQGEYGPLAIGQGKLGPILDRGSRNNPAHHDLGRSADIIGPALSGEVGRTAEGLFW